LWSNTQGFGHYFAGQETFNLGHLGHGFPGQNRGHQVSTGFFEQFNGLFIQVCTMFDAVHTGPQSRIDTIGTMGMGGHCAPHAVGGIHNGFQLFKS